MTEEVLIEILDWVRAGVAIGNSIKLVYSAFQWLREKWNALHPPQSMVEAPMMEADLEMSEKTRDVIIQIFGGDVFEVVSEASYSERVAYAEELVRKLTELYGLDLEEYNLYVDSNMGNCGGFIPKENRIKLNIAAMFSEDRNQVYEFLDTVVHELRHAVQFHAVRSEEFAAQWHVEEETRERWKQNFLNYVSPSQDMYGYIHQPVEEDARAFAHHGLKDIRND